MSWHPAYRQRVLEPDYVFAERYLRPHLLDALTAHLRTVGRLPAFTPASAQSDIAALDAALAGLRDDQLPPQDSAVPDLYFAVSQALEARAGAARVAYLRLGLSRNDLDMTVYKMRAREQLLVTGELLLRLRAELLATAEAGLSQLLIAQTHHQPGQPTTLAHYFAAVENVLSRDSERWREAYDRLNTCPLGAAALAGSSHPLERTFTAELLGFDAPVDNTYDAVASSDWEVELVALLQSASLACSRLTCDLLSWASTGWFRLPDSLVQGSSIMPQKRNPVALEHARTRFSRAIGAAEMVVVSSHNIPYADLNDFGPDVQGALQAQFRQFCGGGELLTACLQEGSFDTDALARAAAATDTTATELADELVRRGYLGFPEAHALAARLVSHVRQAGRNLRAATPADVVAVGGPAVEASLLHDALDPSCFVARRTGLGGPAPSVMKEALRRQRRRWRRHRDILDGRRERNDRAQRSLRAPRKETG